MDSCSQVLQLKLEANEYLINFYRLDNGEKLLTPEELYSAALEANQRATQEKARADRLAAKLRELGVTLDDEG